MIGMKNLKKPFMTSKRTEQLKDRRAGRRSWKDGQFIGPTKDIAVDIVGSGGSSMGHVGQCPPKENV